ncbi:MAG: hypothetical protein ABIO83_09160 [Ilumatobacteraceae bacterium]
MPVDRRDQSWWLRCTTRIHNAGAAPIADNWEWVLRLAADVAALADSLSLSYPRVLARLLVGDAALAGREYRQAHQAYEQALRESVRSGYRLRAADACDGLAALAVAVGQVAAARRATGVATRPERGAARTRGPGSRCPNVPSSERPRGTDGSSTACPPPTPSTKWTGRSTPKCLPTSNPCGRS